MTIWQLLKLHYVYLFSKKNIIAILICIVIAVGINLYSWLDNASLALPSEQIIEFSWQSIFTFDKMIMHIVTIFIMGNFCLPENDQYYCLFIFKKISRDKFFIMKMVVLMVIIVFLTIILFGAFIISGYTLNHYFVMNISYFKAYLYCLIASLSYGFFTIILVKLFPTVMSIIIAIIIFLASDLFDGNGTAISLFPVITIDFLQKSSLISLVLMIIMMVFYFFIAIIANYAKK